MKTYEEIKNQIPKMSKDELDHCAKLIYEVNNEEIEKENIRRSNGFGDIEDKLFESLKTNQKEIEREFGFC